MLDLIHTTHLGYKKFHVYKFTEAFIISELISIALIVIEYKKISNVIRIEDYEKNIELHSLEFLSDFKYHLTIMGLFLMMLIIKMLILNQVYMQYLD